MAENILGLLFVTSSPRGRHVFRYPSNPLRPDKRLNEPIYESATYTATDTAVAAPRRNVLFDSQDRRSSTASLRRYGRAWGDGSSEGTRAGTSFVAPKTLEYGSKESEEYAEEEDTDDILSEDSELDYPGMKKGLSKASGDSNGGPQVNASRRGSVVTEKILPDSPPRTNGRDRFIESEYNSALGYPLDFLSDMLTPPRSAGNRKFETCVDEVVFLGHPVYNSPDGKWVFPPDLEEDGDVHATARGRRTREGGSHLGTVVEGKEISPPEGCGPLVQEPHQMTSTADDDPPTLNMFHLVLILDKPDPKPGAQLDETSAPLTLLDEVYREIAFKWTAAAFALQVQDGYVAREAREMARMREKAINEGIPIRECQQEILEKCSLDRALNQLYSAIEELRQKPSNPLYSHLPTTITVNLADVPISMVLSPQLANTDEEWAHWGEREDASSSEDDESERELLWEDQAKQPGLSIDPWQTLLLVDEEAWARLEKPLSPVVGLGVKGLVATDAALPMPQMSRRVSKETTVEEDEGVLMRSLIETCDISKPLVEIAHILRYDLDGIVIPLARELVQKKKAILIDVFNTRLRTIVMPTTVNDHTSTIAKYSGDFSRKFPGLPPFPSFIGMISASPSHFRNILPKEATSSISARQVYLDALVWLLKRDLVVQVHTRARIFARPRIKEAAWRKMWHRRRDRWLRAQVAEKSPDLTTPRAVDGQIDPMESTVPPPRMDQSFLDYDPDLEMDSDPGEGETAHLHDLEFSIDVTEPEEVPIFAGSFIFRPARAQKDEARWLRVIRESADAVWASKFDLCVQYFDGMTTFEEISYRTNLHRRELDSILELFNDDLVTFLHP